MSDKTNPPSNGNSNGHSLARTDVPATVSFARNPLAKDALYRDLIEVLWRRKWVVIGIVLVCVAYAQYSISKMTPIYTSSARVYIKQNGPRIIGDPVQNEGSANSFMNVQVDRIKSTLIATATIDLLIHTKAKDAPPPLWAPGGWAALERDPKEVAAHYNRRIKTLDWSGNPVAQLKGMLIVEIGKNDDSLEITCDSPYPDEAALIVNKVVEAYQADDVSFRRKGAVDIVANLTAQKEKFETKLTELRAQLTEIRNKISEGAGLMFGDSSKGNPLIDRLQTLSGQWTDAQTKTVLAKSLWITAQSIKNDPDKLEQMLKTEAVGSGTIIQPPSELAVARNRLADLDQQIAAASGTMAGNNPYMKSLQTQRAKAAGLVTGMEQKAAAMYLAVIEQSYFRAERNEIDLKKQYDDQWALVTAANKSAVAIDTLTGEISHDEKMADQLTDRISQIDVTQDVSAPSVSILEPAQAPFYPSKPQKTKLMGIALAVGIFLGVGSAFLLDWMDHRIRTPEDIRSIVQLPILGLVPHVSRRTAFAQLGQAVHLQPRSAVAESFRTVRMAVHFSGIERSCQKILVTSAVLGDGKTVTASNLAIAVAQAGQRAVIVDADFHRPRQHLIFGTPNEAGLSNVLQGQCPLEDVVLTTPIPRVDILPCGPLPANPYELLNSKAFNEIFEVLKLHYDHIIIDSPPVLAVADAMVLAAMADATVLVARVHRSRRQAFEEAVACLGQVGTRILGVVVNDVRGGKERYSLYRTHYSSRGSRLDALDPTRLLGSKKE